MIKKYKIYKPFKIVLVLFAVIGVGFKADKKPELIEKVFDIAKKQYSTMLGVVNGDFTKFPSSVDKEGKLRFSNINDWTGGFWAGSLWYLYEYTGEEKWKSEAIKWTEALEKNQYNTNHHDIGFMMYCSYGHGYRLTQNPTYQDILIQSAKSAIRRYDPKVGLIKSWNPKMSWDKKTRWQYPVIIDNMMNLELLFFASKITGDPVYKNVAIKHAEGTMKNHLRSDYSSYHVVDYDTATGKILHQQTAQGFSDNSTWARGQSWGIYGFTLMYRETKDPRFLKTAKGMADFYLDHKNLPSDKIPYWDYNVNQPGYKPDWEYDASKYSFIPRDASAAAIASSAMLELSTYLGKDGKKYYKGAEKILESLSSPAYMAEPGTNENFILKHSIGSIPHGGGATPEIYADYYFLEALMRYKKMK